MTQNDLYIAQAYGTVTEQILDNGQVKKTLSFTWDAPIFNGIDTLFSDGNERHFSGTDYNIYQFSIQTAPGVRIKLNNNSSDVIVGQTGIWESNLTSLTPISSEIYIYNLDACLGVNTVQASTTGLADGQQFQVIDNQSLTSNTNTYEVSCNYCLIDVIYSINQTGGVAE